MTAALNFLIVTFGVFMLATLVAYVLLMQVAIFRKRCTRKFFLSLTTSSTGKNLKDVKYIYPLIFLTYGYVTDQLIVSIIGLLVFSVYFLVVKRSAHVVNLHNSGEITLYEL